MEITNLNMMVKELYTQWRNLISDLLISNIEELNKKDNQELFIKMRRIHKKLALAVLTQQRNLLAVTGLQSAGKTTLVKRLYGLSNGYLPENLNRGEQLPVLITESNVDSVEGYVWSLVNDKSKGMELYCEKLDEEEFCRVSRDPKMDHLWMELKVPYRYFNSERTSLILLPGFEKDYSIRSQEFLEHILFLSTSSVLVIRKDTYARQDTAVMIDRIKSIYQDVKPILVVSKGDVNPEKNGEFKETLIKDFGISASEEDRVVVSGDPNIFEEPWMESLVGSIQKYGFISEVSYRKQLTMLENLFTEVRDAVDELEEIVKREEEDNIIASKGLFSKSDTHNLVVNFEAMFESHINKLERDIKRQLGQKTKSAVKNFDRYISENKGFWNRFASKFSPKALKEQHEVEKAIMDAWYEAQGDMPEAMIVNTVTEYMNVAFSDVAKLIQLTDGTNREAVEKGGTLNAAKEEAAADTDEGSASRFGFKGSAISPQGNSMAVKANTNVLAKLDSFFGWKENDKPAALGYNELKAMNMLGIMMCRQSIIAQPLLEQTGEVVSWKEYDKLQAAKQEINYKPLNKTMEDVKGFSSQLQELKSLTPMVLKSIPVILGVDVILDGESDIAKNVCTALGAIGINIAPAALLGVLGVGFAAVYTVNAVQKAVYDTNKYQLELSQAGRRVIEQMPEIQTKAFSTSLRNVFMVMSDRLAEKHRQQLGTYDDFGKMELVLYNIRKIRQLNGQLLKEVFANEGVTW